MSTATVDYDVVVAGTAHKSLVAAAYVSKVGLRCLVLESRPTIGGDQGGAQSGELRPATGRADHRMPIEGLYQTGATTHPGGSVSGAPGRNAAMIMLKDFGTSLEEVIRNA